MRLWKASTASRTHNRPLISRHKTEPLPSSLSAAGGTAGSVALASGIVSLSLLLQLAGGTRRWRARCRWRNGGGTCRPSDRANSEFVRCCPRRSRCRRSPCLFHQLAHAANAGVEAGEDRLTDQEMADVQFGELGDGG